MSTNYESELTEHDRKFLETAITCLKSPPELDIPKLSAKLGVKPKTIQNKWGELKRKLFVNTGSDDGNGGEGSSGTAGPAVVPTTPRKRKAATENAEGTPKKTPRTRKPQQIKSEGFAVKEKEVTKREEDAGEV